MSRFFQDLTALMGLLSSDTPPEVNVRARFIISILHGFIDASGRGFGSTILGKDSTQYCIGI
jgi:hypothetical protein